MIHDGRHGNRQALERDHPERAILADALADLMQYKHPDAGDGMTMRVGTVGMTLLHRLILLARGCPVCMAHVWTHRTWCLMLRGTR
jgi:hypothetical protein